MRHGVRLGEALGAVATLAKGLVGARGEAEMVEHLCGVLRGIFEDCRVAVRLWTTADLSKGAAVPGSRDDGNGGCGGCGDCDCDGHGHGHGHGHGAVRGAAVPGAAAPVVGPGEGPVDSIEVPLTLDGEPLGQITLELAAERSVADAREVIEVLGAVLAAFVKDRRSRRDARFLSRWLANTIDDANALIFLVDAGNRVIMVNRALAELLGRSPDDLVGGDIRKWVAPEEHEELERKLAHALGGHPVGGQELSLVGDEGETIPAIFNLARPADLTSTVVAVGQDVSAVKALEHQVMQAEKLASLGQLVAGVVHEINNPLTSITVYADYLLKKLGARGLEENDLAMLRRILQGSNRILKFTRDLVDYGKPTAKESDVISLNETVEQSVSFCEHVIDQAGANLAVNLGIDVPPLYGVKDQLQQVIINLLTNACHALARGGDLSVRMRYLGGGRVAVEVEDNGRGIQGEDLPRIFEPFFTTKPQGEGTGLGLSIVKNIIDFHGGTIMVRSEVGKGTAFCVTLPTGHETKCE